jgi:hypothetical protein
VRALRWWLFLLPCLILFWVRPAAAYPWMIKHEYNNCASCHVDPSGAGLLTAYGRAQSAVLLSSTFGKNPEEDPGPFKDFLFGALPLPDDPEKGALNLGGFVRNAYIYSKRGQASDSRALYMQADLDAQFQYKSFRAYGSIGYAPSHPGADAYSQEAWLTHSRPTGPVGKNAFTPGNAVSRQHWLGLDLADQSVLVRAGRMNLPFGIRQPEHIVWVRSETHTDYNQNQQHGVSVAYNSESIRAEVMGIAGNYQLNPDGYRRRGYSGYVEYVGIPHYAFGVSSLLTSAAGDEYGVPVRTVRQAHGLFTRFSPARPLAVLAEVDMLVTSPIDGPATWGYVGMIQPDVEIVQGLHLMLTGEVRNRGKIGGQDDKTAYRGWLSGAWFIYPHFDVRLDTYREIQSGSEAATVVLAQGHIYLLAPAARSPRGRNLDAAHLRSSCPLLFGRAGRCGPRAHGGRARGLGRACVSYVYEEPPHGRLAACEWPSVHALS